MSVLAASPALSMRRLAKSCLAGQEPRYVSACPSPLRYVLQVVYVPVPVRHAASRAYKHAFRCHKLAWHSDHVDDKSAPNPPELGHLEVMRLAQSRIMYASKVHVQGSRPSPANWRHGGCQGQCLAASQLPLVEVQWPLPMEEPAL